MSTKLKIGEVVPDFEAPATSDLNFKLSSYRGISNLVLYFYPKDSTPGCTTEGQDFRNLYDDFKALDSEVFGVSKDSMKRHDNFKEKQSFPFELISDIEGDVCELFGTWQLKKTFGKEYMGIVRSTFLIDKDGVLRQKWDEVKVKGHANEILEAVRKL
jgi:peroxiredoxin Q/BCP